MITLAQYQARIWPRLGDGTGNWWTAAELTNALNWAQRLFVLLTLCIEDQREWTLTPGSQHYHMLLDPLFPDWLFPLRIRLSNNPSTGTNSEPGVPEPDLPMPDDQIVAPPPRSNMPKLFPSRMADFDSLNDAWRTTTAFPTRYAHLGADLLVLNANAPSALSLLVTFARIPIDMELPTDTPEIPDVDQPVLADLAIVFLRLKDGGQELAKAQALLDRFIAAAKRRSDQVRARSIAEQYDTVPFEVERFDWSRVLGRRENLPPGKKGL